MPELPEVQTTVNGLNRFVKGMTIVDVWTDYDSPFFHGKDTIKDPKYFKYFKKQVVGRHILDSERRGKNILINLAPKTRGKTAQKADFTILIHMKMTGHMMVGKYKMQKKTKEKNRESWVAEQTSGPLADPFNRFIHLTFSLSNGQHLVLSDMRKFAKVTLLPTATAHTTTHLEGIGPEPLDPSFTFEKFLARLHTKKSCKIKPALMDPKILAGVGNIYSDEALWRAGIHPEEKIENIPKNLLQKLYTATLEVLKNGIDFGGDSMSDYRNIEGERGKFQDHHRAYRKTGKPCEKPGCKGKIIRKKVAGRSAHFCDTHQCLKNQPKN